MKENAPEKIYLQPSVIKQLPYQNIVYTKRLADNSIEYTRTDAFIEKACEYLQINLWRVVNEEPDFRQRFVTDFRAYMERE